MVGKLKVDRGIPSDLGRVAEVARAHEAAGYDGCWTGEINNDPFLPLLLAAEHTSTLEVGTSIAVAFARNPMTVAQTAWDLQAYSRGRFLLGLGTQIQPHIEKRFGMPWSHPVRRMAEFVAALREIWRCWRTGDRLRFAGDFYNHTLMTPMFTPAPSRQPDPNIFIAAVGEAMTQVCGEVADGLLAHAFTTRRYLDEVTIPALQRGLDRAGRQRAQFQVSGPVFVVTGRDEGEMTAAAAAYPSRSRSMRPPPPIAGCSTCTAGAICSPSCAGCPSRAPGMRWRTWSTTRCWVPSPSSPRSTRSPRHWRTAATACSTGSCRASPAAHRNPSSRQCSRTSARK